MTGYPRDLVGYADQPPDPHWPGGARLALNFVVNYEEGGERSVLRGDKVGETRLTDLLMPAPRRGARDLNMVSAYEYGSRVGFWRLMRVFAERQVIPTIYAVGMALERNPHAAETMARHAPRADLGWGQAEDFFVSLCDNFDALHREGEAEPKMMTVAVSPASRRPPPRLPVSSITSCATTGFGSADATRSPSIRGASTQRSKRTDERTCYL